MAGNDHAEAGSNWIEGGLREVVKNIERVSVGFDYVRAGRLRAQAP
jgi:hypothetical protein